MTERGKVFIDLGAYNGDTIALALKHIPGITQVYGFEPLEGPYKEMCERFQGRGYYLRRAAGDIEVGEAKVYVGSAYGDISSSLNINNPNCDPERYEVISKIDFPEWLRGNFSGAGDRPYIILKMNIEGGEYAILDKLLSDKTIRLIDELYCDWHWYYIGVSEAEHHQLVRRLRQCGFRLCGDKPDELYNALEDQGIGRRMKGTRIYYKRALKLLLQKRTPRLFRLLKARRRTLASASEAQAIANNRG